jgi:hypothetical protein
LCSSGSSTSNTNETLVREARVEAAGFREAADDQPLLPELQLAGAARGGALDAVCAREVEDDVFGVEVRWNLDVEEDIL